MTLGLEARELRVSMARSMSSSSSPMACMDFGSTAVLSGGGVIVKEAFNFLDGASLA